MTVLGQDLAVETQPIDLSQGFPQGRTALMVIHGIGEQIPFESLDSFTRGLIKYLKTQKVRCKLSHQIVEQQEVDGSSWTESFVRLNSTEQADWSIDIHEYYWAYLTEEMISPAEVWQWLEQTLQGTDRFYKQPENRHLLEDLQENQRISPQPYLKNLSPFWSGQSSTYSWYRLSQVVWRLRFLYPLLRLALFLIPTWPYWKPLLRLRRWIGRQTTQVIVGYIGDIAIYTAMDQKSKYFRIRQKILSGAQALLEAVLKDQDCDRVIVIGHSLGSVIAYDALNRLNIKASLRSKLPHKQGAQFDEQLKKLGGLITFGSPLDKVAFFFREQLGGSLNSGEEAPYIRLQILRHLYSFKAKLSQSDSKEIEVDSPVEPKLDHLPWVNYWNRKDPISGHLHFYTINDKDNVHLDLPERWGEAHNGYWRCPNFYEDIVRRFLLS